jgi:hypothetical protein
MSSNAMSPKALFPSPTSFPLFLLSTQFVLQYSKILIPHYTLLVTTCSTKVSCVFKQSRHPKSSVSCPLLFDLCANALQLLDHLFSSTLFASTLSHPHYHCRARFARHLHHTFTALDDSSVAAVMSAVSYHPSHQPFTEGWCRPLTGRWKADRHTWRLSDNPVLLHHNSLQSRMIYCERSGRRESEYSILCRSISIGARPVRGA